jgi:hypothetical protein
MKKRKGLRMGDRQLGQIMTVCGLSHYIIVTDIAVNGGNCLGNYRHQTNLILAFVSQNSEQSHLPTFSNFSPM